ncbi:MMPL family transporter [Hymenobacter saemangeumensis]|uniref:MMPL family transporter n=1 Tax=Hymenobacter saemangeumensis TaxID=1084522 RepID=A0ABP8IT37_9BACT
MSNVFLGLYRFFHGHKAVFYAVFLATLAVLGFFASRVRFEENVMQMLPHEKRMDEFSHFLETSKFTDRVVVFISDTDTLRPAEPEQHAAYADAVAGAIGRDARAYVGSLTYKASDSLLLEALGSIQGNLPLFLQEKDYAQLDTTTSPASIAAKVQANYNTLISPAGLAVKQFIVADPLGLSYVVLNKLKDFKPDENVELFEDHFFSRDRRHLFMFINPAFPSANTDKNIVFFDQLDQVLQAQASPRYKVHYFGAPAVAAANAKQIRKDTILTLSISLTLLVTVILLFFRQLRPAILMLLPVLFGGLFALAFIALTKGAVSVIAVAAGSIILGIAVNYSLHYLTHYRFHPDAEKVIDELTFPLTIGSLTTVAGFLCLQLVNVPVLQDLGAFAGFSLIGAALSTLIFLPHFLPHRAPAGEQPKLAPQLKLKDLLSRFQQQPALRYVFLGLSPVLLYFSAQVGFEKDMNQVNYMSPKLAQAEAQLNKISSLSKKTVFMVANAPSLDEALARHEKTLPVINDLQAKRQILHFSGVSVLLASQAEQRRRIARWNAYWTPAKKQAVLSSLRTAGQQYKFSAQAFVPFENLLNKEYGLLPADDARILRSTFLSNLIEENQGKTSVLSLITTTRQEAKTLYDRLGDYAGVYIFDRQYITQTLVRVVDQEFTFIAFWTSTLVFVALLLSYGRIEMALVAFLPMVIAWIWILGLMALLDIKFNIINIILSTLVFGLGDDYCIFTMDGLQRRYATGEKEEGSTSISILLSAITTIIGLGTLFFAEHPALRSMAFVSIIGILSVWLVSQTLQPYFFRLFISGPVARRQSPYTLWGLLKSCFAFAYFVFGALLLNIVGFALKLIPANREKKKYFYHWLLSKFTGSLINIMSNVRKLFLNRENADYSRPAVIIANHQSFLDILLLVMQHPKVVLLTSDWVWNSPVFGAVVRMADYFPAAQGAEQGLETLRKKVAEGYSIVIFPEGTRSVDGTMQRFHKGAFFLAENLGLDIQPVLIHGSGDTMRKGHFYLNDGQLTLKFLPRIGAQDPAFGDNYTARTKLISRYFKAEYQKLAEQIENPDYYRNLLVTNYLYKGPVLEWYMKVKLKLEKNYHLFDQLLPRRGHILDIGCGYGFMANMLALTSKERQVQALDYDYEKIMVAQNGFVGRGNVGFAYANALEARFPAQDGIVLSDVLHYLQPEEQAALLQKCADNLNAGGILIIRDGFKELGKKHKGTVLTEWFSTRFCKFNKTAAEGLSFLSTELIEGFAAKNNLEVEVLDTTRYTSNLVFVCKKK